MAALRPRAHKIIAVESVRETPLRELLRRFSDEGVCPVVFKGLGVARLYYPVAETRPLGDVDLLFDRADFHRLMMAVPRLGLRLANVDPAVVALESSEGNAISFAHPALGVVEAHHALYRDCPDAFVTEILSRASPAQVLDAPVRALAIDDLFVVLSVHWATSDPGTRWLWLMDLALIAPKMSAVDWARLVEVAGRHGLLIFVATALAFLDQLWGIRVQAGETLRAAEGSLGRLERWALQGATARAGRGVVRGDTLSVARRLSGRPVRGRRGPGSMKGFLFCHPGAVCIELGVQSSSRWFWLHRARHPWVRMARAARSLYHAVRG